MLAKVLTLGGAGFGLAKQLVRSISDDGGGGGRATVELRDPAGLRR